MAFRRAQVGSLSVDLVQRQRHAAPTTGSAAGADFFFANRGRRRRRWELEDGPRAAGASGRDQWGRGAIAGLLRTAVGGAQAGSLSVDLVQRQRHAAPTTGSAAGADFFFANRGRRRRRWLRAAGPRAAGASGSD